MSKYLLLVVTMDSYPLHISSAYMLSVLFPFPKIFLLLFPRDTIAMKTYVVFVLECMCVQKRKYANKAWWTMVSVICSKMFLAPPGALVFLVV